jgi:hypothetical protein
MLQIYGLVLILIMGSVRVGHRIVVTICTPKTRFELEYAVVYFAYDSY